MTGGRVIVLMSRESTTRSVSDKRVLVRGGKSQLGSRWPFFFGLSSALLDDDCGESGRWTLGLVRCQMGDGGGGGSSGGGAALRKSRVQDDGGDGFGDGGWVSEEGRGKDGWDGEASSCFIAWETFRAGVGVGVHCGRRIKVMVPLGRRALGCLPCCAVRCGAVRVRGAARDEEGLANLLAFRVQARQPARATRTCTLVPMYLCTHVPAYYFQNLICPYS